MLKRLPVIPTLLVLVAVAVMVRLGFWQLDRLEQKEAALAQYVAAQSDMTIHDAGPRYQPDDRMPYLRIRLDCTRNSALPPRAGHNARGETGWAQQVRCTTSKDDILTFADVVIGWSRDPAPVDWDGGWIVGRVVPRGNKPAYIVAETPVAGLEPNARPDPRNIPNNHLAYAIQWFLFAATALVIYALALRKRLRDA